MYEECYFVIKPVSTPDLFPIVNKCAKLMKLK